jgi:polyhydroxybutyrate depolymerase
MRATVPLLFLTVLILTACEGATGPVRYEDFYKSEGEGEFGIWVHSGLYNRLYTVHTPPNVDDGASHPLLVFLHGAGGTGEGIRRVLRPHALTDSAGFITVYPNGLEETWSIGCGDCNFAEVLEADDVRFLETLTRHLAEHLPVDTTRVYLAGFSQGGSLAYLYGCRSGKAPAGIAVAASLIYREVLEGCDPAAPFPVMVVHGTADLMAYYLGYGDEVPLVAVPQTVDMWRQRMGCEAEPARREYPDTARDYTTVTSFLFTGCEAGSSVVHLRVNDGGHTWPGDTGPWSPIMGPHSRNIEMTREMLEFFDSVRETQTRSPDHP